MTAVDPRIAFFDHHAPLWDTYGPPSASTLARLEHLKTDLALQPGQNVLEVGCGTGQVTAWLVERVQPGRVTAIDFAPTMLTRAAGRGTGAEFRCLDVCNESPGRATFDLAFCLNAFPHFRDQPAALRNLAAALRPGAELVVLHLDHWESINNFHAHLDPPLSLDLLPPPADWPGLLATAGLELRLLRDEPDLFLVRAVRS